jgi:MFS family permease
MILYAKSLGASATVLGIITGMMPLLVIFQIPAAHYIHRFGYKKFVYRGWGIRVMFIYAMSLVPLTGAFLNLTAQLSLLLFLLFAFNLSRGISSCAWLPWITSLIREPVRGTYLTRDAAFVNLASFVAILFSAACLGQAPGAARFSGVFAFSAISGMISLFFLKRIPEGGTLEETNSSATPVPWRVIARFKPFRKLLRMNIAWAIASGGLGAFTVAFLKSQAGWPENQILLVSSVAYLGGLSSLWLLGARLDRIGSKPVLLLSMIGWLAIMAIWVSLSGGVLAVSMGVALPLLFAMGLGAALVHMSTIRLAMSIIPEMGRSHFFALFSVVGSLSLGGAPIIWGIMIDAVGPARMRWVGLEINQFTLFFLLAGVAVLITVFFCAQLEEPKAVRMEALLRQMLMQSPLRFWFRFWPRN